MKNLMLCEMMKKLRKDKRWSAKRMAKTLGVDERTLLRYENGESYPRSVDLICYCEVFKVTFDYLLYGIEISDKELYDKIRGLTPKQRKAVMSVLDSYL